MGKTAQRDNLYINLITCTVITDFLRCHYLQHKTLARQFSWWAGSMLTFWELFIMAKHCPNCQSRQITKRHYGKKAGGMLGAAAGASTGAASAMGGAELGSTIGLVAGPIGSAVGGMAGAVLGGLFGAVAGGTVGSKAGEFVDQKILDNYECLNCGHVFSKRRK